MKTSATTRPICPVGESHCDIIDEVIALRSELDDLKKQVRTDTLTGLFNRQHLLYTLEQEFERTQRNQQPTTLIFLDIDHFKIVNDTYGHIVGDKVLVHIAEVLLSAVRKLDIACRYGGEEFAIILPSTHLLVGIQVAERLRSKIAETPLQLDSGNINITASLGVGAYQHNSQDSIEDFIARTDKVLYQAKNSGRNQVCHSTQEQGDKIKTSSTVSVDERRALFDDDDS